MKFFWSLILGLVLLTAAMFALRPGPGGGAGTADAGTGTDTGRAADAQAGGMVAASDPVRRRDVRPEPTGMPGDPRAPAIEGSADPAAAPGSASSSGFTQPTGMNGIAHRHTDHLPDHPAFALVRVSDPATVSDWLDDLLDVDYTPTLTMREPSAQNEGVLVDAPPMPTGGPLPTDFDPNDPNLLAGRFPLRGSGTKADPYQLPWEAFVAVRETYRPRTGHNELPAWLDRIDGKYIALTGYLMLPLVQEATDEVLLMRNQWDGCCIGVPPTPYDGIEVKLNKPMAGQSSWRMNYGTITGKLAVDPYIVSGWLIGLYLLDDAVLVDSGL